MFLLKTTYPAAKRRKEIRSKNMNSFSVCGFRGALVIFVAFRQKGRGFKSTHGCSDTVQKPLFSPRLFGQWTLSIYLPFTIFSVRPLKHALDFVTNTRALDTVPKLASVRLKASLISLQSTKFQKRWLNDGLQARTIRSQQESLEDVTYT